MFKKLDNILTEKAMIIIMLCVIFVMTIVSVSYSNVDVEITSGLNLEKATAFKYGCDPETGKMICEAFYDGNWYPTDGYVMPDYETYREAWLALYPREAGHAWTEERIRAWYDNSIPSSYFGYYTEPFRWDIQELKDKYNELKGA